MEHNSHHGNIPCIICNNEFGGKCRSIAHEGGRREYFECDICGKYGISIGCKNAFFSHDSQALSATQRSKISHFIKLRQNNGNTTILNESSIRKLIDEPFINPIQQASKAISYFGDEILKNGSFLKEFPIDFYALIGSPNPSFANNIITDLIEIGIIKISNFSLFEGGIEKSLSNVSLTLHGWERYNNEKRGKFSGNYGFVAMQFNDSELENLIKTHAKPHIKKILNYELMDVRDDMKAGVIDNLIRTQIRDSAFVVSDLTHDNRGAYWEAGFAEGVGKPVIYICKKEKFDSEKTHFDTNHSTTVLWDINEIDKFLDLLTATIRNSLYLYDQK